MRRAGARRISYSGSQEEKMEMGGGLDRQKWQTGWEVTALPKTAASSHCFSGHHGSVRGRTFPLPGLRMLNKGEVVVRQ